MQISEKNSLSLSFAYPRFAYARTLRESKRPFLLAHLFSRGLPHILSNEQGERGKFTIFYPFLLKERRLHTHEAECTRSRCAFWFQVSDPGTIQGDDQRSLVDHPLRTRWKISSYVRSPIFLAKSIWIDNLISYFSSYRIELIPSLKKHPNDPFVAENLANNSTEIACKSRGKKISSYVRAIFLAKLIRILYTSLRVSN